MNKKRTILAILIGIVLVSAGLFSMFTLYKADTVGQQEIEHYFAGIACTKPSEDLLAGNNAAWMYYNFEDMKLETESWSTWNPSQKITYFGKHDFSARAFTLDADMDDKGMPDYAYKFVSQYSSTDTGAETNSFISTPVDLEFYDPIKEASRTIRFHRTYITMQMTLRVQGQHNILSTQNVGGRDVPYAMTAEFQGDYQQNYGSKATSLDFMDGSTTTRLVIRIDVKNWKLDDYYHIDKDAWDGLGNAIIWSKITDVNMDDVDQTAGWDNPLQYSGDFDMRKLDLYSNINDALLQSTPLPEKDAQFIELGDTLYPTVYTNLDHSVWLGSNLETYFEGNLKAWDVSDFFVKFKITSCILSTWQESLASEGEMDITNPFAWDESVGTGSDWFTKAFNWLVLNLGGGNTLKTVIYLVLIIAFILMIIMTVINPTWIVKFFGRIGKGLKNIYKRATKGKG